MAWEIRADHKPQGRKALVCEWEEYFRLMGQGLSSQEACRIVGANYRTGKRWRNGWRATPDNKAKPPISRPGTQAGPARYQRQEERIADRLREGASLRAVAAGSGRSRPRSAGRSGAIARTCAVASGLIDRTRPASDER
jgi:transposase, IS30 family